MVGEDKPLRDDLQRWLVIASIAVVLVVVVMKYVYPSGALSAATDLITILLTFFVSYAVSSHFARKTARSELRGLAEATGEHVFLLSSQIRGLADETLEFAPVDDRSAIYLRLLGSQMYKLASQAELSFHNTQRLAGLDISIPALRDEVRTTIEEATRRESIPCPHCRRSSEVLLNTTPGTTRALQCQNSECRKPFSVHRTSDGKIKVTFEDAFRIACPNPSCTHAMTVRRRNEWGTVIRNCFECFARIRYNLDTNVVEGYDIETPLTVPAARITDGRGQCPYCGHEVAFRGMQNSRGQIVQYCPNCTKLMLVEEVNDPPV